MKKLTVDDKQQLLIHAEGIEKRRLRKKRYRGNDTQNLRVFSRVRIYAPSNLDLFNSENYNKFVGFITDIRDEINKGNRVIINFRNTESLKACAMVVLYAHIDSFQRMTGDKNIITLTPCGNNRTNKMFSDCGVWGLTHFQKFSNIDALGLPVVSSVAGASKDPQVNQEARATIKQVLNFIKEKIYGGNISPQEAQNLYAAVTESISNVGLHAYSSEEQFKDFLGIAGKRWWIFTRLIEDQMFILIYDMGEGIPLTLVKRDIFSVIFQMFRPETDADKIHAAVQYGETRMKSDKHGKGLPDIRRFVLDNPLGELHIFSGMGRYSYYSSSKKEEKLDYKFSVGGTLIQWNIFIEAKK
ncbi:hypothetical protein [Serratia liquefaciens]|uniref:hypothetical protein n=1 Tax=Serratia liquefaciens TaxID=614 RepID=UPI00095AE329|nr:hypothetical protein [Serratia liquefaciens]OKP25305.1 hypothetical protein BSQ35_02180 [Serratia liquefaciens]